MKEITITNTVKIPEKKEIEVVAKKSTHLEPRQAIIVNCFVMGYDFESDENRTVYECMKEADRYLRNDIASDVVTAYCEANGIKWGTIRVINVNDLGKHFVIEAVVEEAQTGNSNK